MRFSRRLEEDKLVPPIPALVNKLLGAEGVLLHAGAVVDATLIAAPSPNKNVSAAAAFGQPDVNFRQLNQ